MSELASKNQLRLSFTRWALVSVPLIIFLGALSGLLSNSGQANHWYAQLNKPDVMPPGWAFGVIWTTLYALMGLSVAMVLDARGAAGRPVALTLFGLQLCANLAWSPVFFALHQAHFAVLLLVIILVLALATTLLFGQIRTVSAWLMVPYLAWLCIAASLAYQTDQLNPNAAQLGTIAGTAHIGGGN